jgi:hypothetical protein
MLLIDIVLICIKKLKRRFRKIDSFFKRKTCEDGRDEEITTPTFGLDNVPKLKNSLLMNSSPSKCAMCHFKVF